MRQTDRRQERLNVPVSAQMRVPVSMPCIGPLERRLVRECLAANRLTQGPNVERFESALAEYLGVPYVCVTSSGTTALHLALAALGIGPGDKVIVPDLTFVATANAVRYCGAEVVLVDIDPRTWTIDTRQVERLLATDKAIRAIIPVHLYGVGAGMVELWRLSADYHVHVIEDAAEGLGGVYRDVVGRAKQTIKLGASDNSVMSTFSFYGNKVITTGEGGAVVTHYEGTYQQLRFLRGQGVARLDPSRDLFKVVSPYDHTAIGYNYRMTDLQACIGVGQLSHVDEMIESRRKVVDQYRRRLNADFLTIDNARLHAPCTSPAAAPWLFTVDVGSKETRDGLMNELMLDAGVDTRPAFVPLHRLPMYSCDRALPVASHVGDCAVSLPTYPQLPLDTVDAICDRILYSVYMTG